MKKEDASLSPIKLGKTYNTHVVDPKVGNIGKPHVPNKYVSTEEFKMSSVYQKIKSQIRSGTFLPRSSE